MKAYLSRAINKTLCNDGKPKGALTGTRRKQGYRDVVRISILKCISGQATNLFHHVQFNVLACAPVLYKNVTHLHALRNQRSSFSNPEAFSAPPRLFLSLFRPLLLAFHVFSPIFSSLESFMHFCLIFFFMPPLCLGFFLNGKEKKQKKKTKTGGFNVPGSSLFTRNTKHMNHFYSYSDGPLNDTAGGFWGQMCIPILR